MFKLRFNYLLFILIMAFSTNAFAINFELTDYQNKKYQLADYKGKWVVLNYWATWCPPCRRELPMLVDYNEAREDVQIFGINYEPDIKPDTLKNFVETYFINFPTIPATKAIDKKFGIPPGLPMTIFISPEGKIVKKMTGMLTKSFMDKTLK